MMKQDLALKYLELKDGIMQAYVKFMKKPLILPETIVNLA